MSGTSSKCSTEVAQLALPVFPRQAGDAVAAVARLLPSGVRLTPRITLPSTIWLGSPSGLMIAPAVVRHHHARDLHRAGLLVDPAPRPPRRRRPQRFRSAGTRMPPAGREAARSGTTRCPSPPSRRPPAAHFGPPRASAVCRRRNASADRHWPSSASSSMNDSLANELEKLPGLRSADAWQRPGQRQRGRCACRARG